MNSTEPGSPPQKKKDEVDYYIVTAVSVTVVGLFFCLIRSWAAFIILPVVIALVTIKLRKSAKYAEQIKAETDHLRVYQKIYDIEKEVRRIKAESKTKRDAADLELNVVLSKTNELRAECGALRNRIEGYGDAYVIPTHTLIDQLGDDYEHTLAGQKLKAARAKTRELLKGRKAVQCSQANPDVKKAVERVFVVAFNGDADEILSRAKHDNFGKLTQELIDAQTLANKNGETFATSITKQYLEARIEELRWITITHELKKREIEEQRELRDRQREEERAAREYAKAIADAEKEEKAIKAALEKAQQEADHAAGEERAKFEEQLRMLAARLIEAEARGQRAISMAQQTRAGTVYIISNVGAFGENVFKIGMTRRLDAQDRIDELSDASVPFDFDIHAFIKTDNAPALENKLHKQFEERRMNKVNLRKEFFQISATEIRNALGDELANTQFTMLAEAREYRESLALARQAGDPLTVPASVS